MSFANRSARRLRRKHKKARLRECTRRRGAGGVKARNGLSHPRFLRLVCYLPAFRRGPQSENKFYNMPLTYIFPFDKVIIKTSLSDFVKKTRKRKMLVDKGGQKNGKKQADYQQESTPG